MNVSTNGIELIKQFEGCSLKAYKCPAGIWTIGYGHTNGVKEGQKITQTQANTYLMDDLKTHERYVNNLQLPLNQNQFDALVSFCYNCGPGNLRTLIKNRTLPQIADAFLLYNKGGGVVLNGLIKRRNAERELFLKPTTATRYKVIAMGLNVRSGPGINYDRVNILYKNKIVEITKISSQWGMLSNNTGWVCLNYLKKL